MGLNLEKYFFKQIENLKCIEQFPFIKNPKWQDIAFNKSILLELNKENPNKKDLFFNAFFTKKNNNFAEK